MRSVEQSSVEGDGVGLATDAADMCADQVSHFYQFVALIRSHFSPITFAVALTALVGLLALLITDFARTRHETTMRLSMIAYHLAREVDQLDAANARMVFADYQRQSDSDILITLGSGPKPILASTSGQLQASATLGGSQRSVIVTISSQSIFGAVWARTGSLLALFVLVVGAQAVWRRPQTAFSAKRSPKPSAGASTLETLPFGLANWTSEGELLSCNALFCQDLGLAPGEFEKGARYADFIAALEEIGSLVVTLDTEEGRTIELRPARGNTLTLKERPLATGGFVILVEQGEGQSAVEYDISSHEFAERNMAETANRAKTAFLAHLSHDLRTPLNHIIGFADLLAHQIFGPLGNDRYLGYVADIKQSGQRLSTSLTNILELAELEGGKRHIRTRDFPLARVTSNLAERFKDAARSKNIGLDLDISSNVFVRADPLTVTRMLANLLDNALCFTPSGGVVKLAIWEAQDGVVVEISDTGIGISPERLPLLTEPFSFADACNPHAEGSVGFGLAIAKAIAEANGGRLAIDSTPGLGTTVAVSLPRRIAPNAPLQVAAA